MDESLNGAARQAANRVLDLLLPPQCLSCGRIVEETGTLCSACWEETSFLAPPWCESCGLPFTEDPGPGARCGACLRRPPAYARARAAMVYDRASRGMVLAFKHADRTDMASAFAVWLARAGRPLIDECQVVVPVPLHWVRLFQRRFNQAALVAQKIAGSAGKEFAPDALVRKRRTPTQAGLGFAGRRRNVRGAFRVAAKCRSRIRDRRVLLVDDVMTTGATVSTCAATLIRGGAAAVDVLTIARVVRGEPE